MAFVIAPDLIRQLLDYDPETGVLTWRARTPDMFEDGGHSAAHRCANWNAAWAGKVAGRTGKNGYRQIAIFDRRYYSHRLAWVITTGAWPKDQIDHINSVRDDNRLANLREATQSQNSINVPVKRHNVSGLKGVSWHAKRREYASNIRANGVAKHLGWFKCPAAAHFAYLVEADKLHGEYARNGG